VFPHRADPAVAQVLASVQVTIGGRPCRYSGGSEADLAPYLDSLTGRLAAGTAQVMMAVQQVRSGETGIRTGPVLDLPPSMAGQTVWQLEACAPLARFALHSQERPFASWQSVSALLVLPGDGRYQPHLHLFPRPEGLWETLGAPAGDGTLHRALAAEPVTGPRRGWTTLPRPVLLLHPMSPRHGREWWSVSSTLPVWQVAWRVGYLMSLLLDQPIRVGETRLDVPSDMDAADMAGLLEQVYGEPVRCDPVLEDPDQFEQVNLCDSVMQATGREWGSPAHRAVVARPGARRAITEWLLRVCDRQDSAQDGEAPGPEAAFYRELLHTGTVPAPWWTEWRGDQVVPHPAGRVFRDDPQDVDWPEGRL